MTFLEAKFTTTGRVGLRPSPRPSLSDGIRDFARLEFDSKGLEFLTMAEQVSFRRAQVVDADALSELSSRIHGSHRPTPHWEWKYRDNPVGELITSIAEIEGRIVGQIAGLPFHMHVQGRHLRASQEVDIYVDDEFRKGATFFRLYKKRWELNRESDIDFSFGITIAVTSKIAEKVMKCHVVAPVPRLVKVLDVSPFVRRRIPIRPLAGIASKIANRTLRAVPSGWDELPAGTQLESIAKFDSRFDCLWKQVESDYTIRVIKDAAYLNWRYAQIPDEHYESIALVNSDSKEVRGIIVVGHKTGDVHRGRIIDIITPRAESGEITRPLLAAALRRFQEWGAETAVCWMFPHCHVRPFLDEAGFQPRETEGHNLVVNIMEEKDGRVAFPKEIAMNPESWYIVQGDSDDY